MKYSKRKTSLLTGLAMIITGTGGIGYIPGKSMLLTVVFMLVLAAGVLITVSCARRRKSSHGTLQDRNTRMSGASGRRKNYSQYTA